MIHKLAADKPRTVQLYGGGMDSHCIDFLFKPDVKLYCHLGTVEASHEAEVALQAGAVVDHRLQLADQVLSNSILPARNLLLVAIAAYYGNRIWLGATAGDTTRDKDETFLSSCSELLDHILGHDPDKALPFHKHGIVVEAPAARMTKTQLVERYLREGGNPVTLLRSRSCYRGGRLECGECRSCVRKFVALRLNGLTPVFAKQPDLRAALAYSKSRGRGLETSEIERLLQS